MTIDNQKLEEISQGKDIVFSLHNKSYAVPLAKVKEIIRPPLITPLPKVQRFYKGLINVRGQIISVIDMRLVFGMPEVEITPKKTCVIIIHVGNILTGIVVDEIDDVTSYKASEITPENQESNGNQNEGVFAIAKNQTGNLTLLLDIEKSLRGTAFENTSHLHAS